MSFEFAHPWVLAFLIFIPPLAAWALLPRLRRKRTPTFLFSTTHRLIGGLAGPRLLLFAIIDILFIAALALLIIAMARPQSVEYLPTEVEGIDIFIAFDMSGSMRAVDADEAAVQSMIRRGSRPKTRFEQAKDTLQEFIASRPNDRIGIVLFARDAFLQFPLTLDHGLLTEGIGDLELGDIDAEGTAIGNAVGRSLAGLRHSDAETRLVILITDGDRRGGNISPMQAAEMAKEMQIPVYAILVGREGSTLVEAGRNPFTGMPIYRHGEFPVAPELLQEMSEATGGQFFRANDAVSMAEDLHAIFDEYDKSLLEDKGRRRQTERYHNFLLGALMLLSLHFLGRHTFCRSFP